MSVTAFDVCLVLWFGYSLWAVKGWGDGKQIADVRPTWRRLAQWVLSAPAYAFMVAALIVITAAKILIDAITTSSKSLVGIRQEDDHA